MVHIKGNNEPFIVVLIRELFDQENVPSEEVEPITAREFYISLSLIAVAFLFMSWLFKTLPF